MTGDPQWPSLYSHPDEHDSETGAVVAGTPLEEHCETVAERCVAAVPDGTTTENGNSLADAAAVVGWLHDVGKATEWFQTSLEERGTPNGPTHHARVGAYAVYVALDSLGFGSTVRIAAIHAVAKHHGALDDTDDYVPRRLSEIRSDWESGLNAEAKRQVEHLDTNRRTFVRWLFEQATGDPDDWDEFRAVMHDHEQLRGRLATRDTDSIDETHPLSDDTGGIYTRTLQLWGALAFADITAASGIEDDDERLDLAPDPDDPDTRIDPETIRAYAEKQGDDDATGEAAALNEVRSETQKEIEKRADELASSDEQAFSLTLPTGYGKTVAGTLAALHLRSDPTDPVVYALPFTSVIDQTASVLQDEEALGTDALGRLLTVHHHLAETLTTLDEEDFESANEEPLDPTDEEAEVARLLAEAWRSRMTLTTFVQLFESLAAPDRGQSVKLPALKGAVIVLDEPQALPLHWWPLVRGLVAILTAEYDAQVISMTATQPRLLPDPEPLLERDRLEAIEHEAFDGEPPSRVSYEFDESAVATDDETVRSYDDAAHAATSAAEDGPTLCVCNTIDSARQLSDVVVETADVHEVAETYDDRLPNRVGGVATDEDGTEDTGEDDNDGGAEDEESGDEGGKDAETEDDESVLGAVVSRAESAAEEGSIPLVHLSTRLRPCDRSFLISVVEELTERGIPSLVVSTQLIEAGVDVSFRRVFRDVAPLDSIVQAAGRCNRSYGDEQGRVTVWRLPSVGDDDGMPPSTAVYARTTEQADADTLRLTREALDEVGIEAGQTVDGRTVARETVETYHDRLGKVIDEVVEQNDRLDLLREGKFRQLGQESLVGTGLSFEVYVCRTPEEQTRVRQLSEAYRDRNFDAVERIRSELAEIRVSVPVYDSTSEDAEQLGRLPPIDPRADRANATERSLDAMDQHEHAFDERAGVDQDELGVEARFF